MKVRAGTLTDEQREIIFASNRDGRRVLVHTAHYCPIRGHRTHQCGENACMVGVVLLWDYDSFRLGSPSGSFETNIPWESARDVWWRDEAPEPCPYQTCVSNMRKAVA